MQTTKYAAVLPKIGSERSKLLSESKLKALSESRNVSEVAAGLRDTDYQEQISHVPPPFTGRKLEHAYFENLVETYLKLIKYSAESSVRYLDLYLSRIELENVKTLVRGAYAKLSAEQKLARIYLSVEKYFRRVPLMEEAAKAPTVTAVVAAFKGTEYADPLNAGLKSFEESGSPISLDIFVDKLFYERLFCAYKKLPRREKSHAKLYASIENDSFILLTLLRGKNLNYDPNWLRLAVPTNYFNLDKKEVEAVVSAINYEAAYKTVQEGYYAKYFERAATVEDTLANAEKAFRKELLVHAQKSVIREKFNIGSTLGFITMKEAEVHNLTAITLGVEGAMKPEAIRNQLFL